MRNYLLKISAFFAVMFIVLTFAGTGSAQYRNSRGRNVSRPQVEQLIKRIEDRTDKFSNQLNKSLDRSRLDGSRTEDNITERVRDLENATDSLRRHFDKNDARADNMPEVRAILNSATAVNRIVNRRNFSRQAENSWFTLRTEINALARIYGLRAIGTRNY